MAERDALLRFKHPFFTRLHYSFQVGLLALPNAQDSENLYFVVQYCAGGDLASMIKLELSISFKLLETIAIEGSTAPSPSFSFTPRR